MNDTEFGFLTPKVKPVPIQHQKDIQRMSEFYELSYQLGF